MPKATAHKPGYYGESYRAAGETFEVDEGAKASWFTVKGDPEVATTAPKGNGKAGQGASTKQTQAGNGKADHLPHGTGDSALA